MQDLINVQKNAMLYGVRYYQKLGNKLWDCLGLNRAMIENLDSVTLLGSGSSFNATRIGQFYFESICRIPGRFCRPSEFMHRPIFPQENNLHLFVSASGERKNILKALDYVKSLGFHSAGITNSPTSDLVKNSDGFFLTHLPQEYSTKPLNFAPQLIALYWLANRIAVERGLKNFADLEKAELDILKAIELFETLPKINKKYIADFHSKYYSCKKFIFVGRCVGYPFAMESSFQLEQACPSIYSKGYPCGEFVRGPLQQEDKNSPIILFSVPNKQIYENLIDDAQEIRSNNGHLISFAFEDQKELISLSNYAFIIPKTSHMLSPIAVAGLMQVVFGFFSSIHSQAQASASVTI